MNENIDFPHKEYRVYKNSFLQNTVFAVSYENITEKNLTGDFEEKKNSFFNRYFRINQENSDFINKGISISTKDKSLSLIFKSNYCMTNVNCSVYKTFVDSVLPHVFEIYVFLNDIIKLNELKSVSVRKVNVFPVIVDETMNLSIMTERQKVLANVLSANFMQLHHEPEQIQVENAVWPFGVRKIANQDGYIYTLKTGILNSNSPGTKYVVLDSMAELSMILRPNDLEAKAVELNDNLFNLYHWAVNPEIIEKM